MPDDIREQLIHTIMKTFSYTKKQANHLFTELLMCDKRRDLVIIINKIKKQEKKFDLLLNSKDYSISNG